ncbi:MAG: hypothetical protein ACFCU1_03485 [Sumerlaeia bacterium]
MTPSDHEGPDIEMDEEGIEYLSKLTEALKNRNKMPYKPRVAGQDRKPVGPQSGVHQKLPKTDTPQPVSQQRASATAHQKMASSGVTPGASQGTFPTGTILRLEDQTLCIYKDIRPDKDYEVVLMLLPDGSVKAQGIALETYDLKSIGHLPPEFVLSMQRKKQWTRDEIIYHLSSFDYCAFVPQIQGPQPARASQVIAKPTFNVAAEETEKMLVPGRELTISFGPNQEWKAIYWGEDDLGTIIAHSTNNNWTLMHMDLTRFLESIKYGQVVDRTLMDHIHACVGN